jgi:hypothetical protein
MPVPSESHRGITVAHPLGDGEIVGSEVDQEGSMGVECRRLRLTEFTPAATVR